MIRQEITYYPDTFQTKEYKEYQDGVLNVHTKYDENNNTVYLYLAYQDLESFRKFEDGSYNSNGEIIYFKDNKGQLKIIDGGLTYKIQETFNVGDCDYFDFTITPKDGENILTASCRLVYGIHNCHNYSETLPNGDLLKYNQQYFQEIYYEYWEWSDYLNRYLYTGNRKIISFDELMELTQFKDFLVEHKILPVTNRYLLNTVRKKTVENLYI